MTTRRGGRQVEGATVQRQGQTEGPSWYSLYRGKRKPKHHAAGDGGSLEKEPLKDIDLESVCAN